MDLRISIGIANGPHEKHSLVLGSLQAAASLATATAMLAAVQGYTPEAFSSRRGCKSFITTVSLSFSILSEGPSVATNH